MCWTEAAKMMRFNVHVRLPEAHELYNCVVEVTGRAPNGREIQSVYPVEGIRVTDEAIAGAIYTAIYAVVHKWMASATRNQETPCQTKK